MIVLKFFFCGDSTRHLSGHTDDLLSVFIHNGEYFFGIVVQSSIIAGPLLEKRIPTLEVFAIEERSPFVLMNQRAHDEQIENIFHSKKFSYLRYGLFKFH